MLLGYVSDERYLALSGVEIEILGPQGSIAVRSRASGAVYAEIDPGRYEFVLSKAGYGTITTEIAPAPEFFFAEDYHQQYLDKVPNGYCPIHATGVKLPDENITVGMGNTELWDTYIVTSQALAVRNLRSFSTGLCDGPVDLAYWITNIPPFD